MIGMKLAQIERLPWLLWLTTLALGAALTVLAVLLYYRMGGQSEANIPLRWTGADVQLVGSRGTLTPAGLEIPSFGSQGLVLWMPRAGSIPGCMASSLGTSLAWMDAIRCGCCGELLTVK